MKRAIVVLTAVVLAWSGQAAAATPHHQRGHTMTTNRVHARSVDYSYGTDSVLQTATLYPALAPSSPLVVLVHGGGFRSSAGDAKKLASNAATLVSNGLAVAVVNYRDDQGTGAFPYQVDDVVNGTNWAITNAALANGDGSRVTLLGGSSGGTLAALAAGSLGASLRHVVTLSATTDLGAAQSYWAGVPGPVGKLHTKNLKAALNGLTAASWSPALTTVAAGPDWVVFNGATEEQPRSQADALVAHLQAAGSTVVETIVPTSNHAYDYWSIIQGQLIAEALA
jgi:acetyl esterase/lipase